MKWIFALVVFLILVSLPLAGGIAVAAPQFLIGDVRCAVTEPVCLLVVPDGSGPSFTEARTINGTVVDATVEVLIVWGDEYNCCSPMVDVDAESIVLIPNVDQTHGCIAYGTTCADRATDQEGWTAFTRAPRAGGWSMSDLRVFLGTHSSSFYFTPPDLPIYFNSPDLSGDGKVDLIDLSIFSGDYLSGTAPFRSDLHWDGEINLLDLVVLANHYGAACP